MTTSPFQIYIPVGMLYEQYEAEYFAAYIDSESLSQNEGTLLTTQKDGIELKAPLITARRKHAIQFIIESLRAVAHTGIVFLLIPRNARLVVS